MRRSGRSKSAKWLVTVLATGLIGSLMPRGVLATDFFGTDFEKFTGIPAEAAEELVDKELDELRGGYLGFFFQVTFTAFAETQGVTSADLDVDVHFGDQSGTLSFEGPGTGSGTGGTPVAEGSVVGPSATVNGTNGQPFLIQATIGEAFQGANGVFQIGQIPGNENNLAQSLYINLWVVQANETTARAIGDRLSSMIGN
jgi:hypothetical protein